MEETKADLREQKRDIENALKRGMSPVHPRTGYDWRGRLKEIDRLLKEEA